MRNGMKAFKREERANNITLFVTELPLSDFLILLVTVVTSCSLTKLNEINPNMIISCHSVSSRPLFYFHLSTKLY